MTSCEGGGSKVHNVEFKRMHLNGVTALALASEGSDEQKAPRRVPAAEGEGEITYETHQPVFRFRGWHTRGNNLYHRSQR